MDLRQLRYFIALTEYRSFVRAAEAMGITQPAFSRAIQSLEHSFGSAADDFTPHLQTEHLAVLRSVVQASDAIGSASEEAVAEDLASGRLVRLHWRNLPPALEVLSVRCGVVSRSGYRLSPAARAMIETLMGLDRSVRSAAIR